VSDLPPVPSSWAAPSSWGGGGVTQAGQRMCHDTPDRALCLLTPSCALPADERPGPARRAWQLPLPPQRPTRHAAPGSPRLTRHAAPDTPRPASPAPPAGSCASGAKNTYWLDPAAAKGNETAQGSSKVWFKEAATNVTGRLWGE